MDPKSKSGRSGCPPLYCEKIFQKCEQKNCYEGVNGKGSRVAGEPPPPAVLIVCAQPLSACVQEDLLLATSSIINTDLSSQCRPSPDIIILSSLLPCLCHTRIVHTNPGMDPCNADGIIYAENYGIMMTITQFRKGVGMH